MEHDETIATTMSAVTDLVEGVGAMTLVAVAREALESNGPVLGVDHSKILKAFDKWEAAVRAEISKRMPASK